MDKATPEDQAKFDALLARWPVLTKTLDETNVGNLWKLYKRLDFPDAIFRAEDVAMLKFCVAYTMASAVVDDEERLLED